MNLWIASHATSHRNLLGTLWMMVFSWWRTRSREDIVHFIMLQSSWLVSLHSAIAMTMIFIKIRLVSWEKPRDCRECERKVSLSFPFVGESLRQLLMLLLGEIIFRKPFASRRRDSEEIESRQAEHLLANIGSFLFECTILFCSVFNVKRNQIGGQVQ